MNWSDLFQLLLMHLGEILLGIEFFVLSRRKDKQGKLDTLAEKLNRKKDKLIAKKEKYTGKSLAKIEKTMSEIEELKKSD